MIPSNTESYKMVKINSRNGIHLKLIPDKHYPRENFFRERNTISLIYVNLKKKKTKEEIT